jgi:hypothetical protein
MLDKFYILSVQVGWNTIHSSTVLASCLLIEVLKAIAPPKSYPNKITFFFELNPKTSNNLHIN